MDRSSLEAGRQASFKWPLAGRRRTDVNGEKSRNFDDNRPEPVPPLTCLKDLSARERAGVGRRGPGGPGGTVFTAGKWGGVRNEVGVGGRDEVFWNTVRLEKKCIPKLAKARLYTRWS